MKNILKYTFRENQYYPTPEKVVKDVLRNLNFYDLEEIKFLEPCAGDGAICRAVKNHFSDSEKPLEIECIEIEKMLRDSLKGQGFKVVAEDFEEFESPPIYNLIFMNPPFSKGAKFLMKAYRFLNAGGKLICLLNAETIKNPCTKEREYLKALIDRSGEVHYMKDAFSESERKTDVEIAVVILEKSLYENEFDIFGGIQENVLTEEDKIKEELKQKVTDSSLMSSDELDRAISIYRNAVKQIFQGIDTIKGLKKGLGYLENEAEEFNIKTDDFVKYMLEEKQEDAKEKSIKSIRKMIWSYVLKYCKMDQYLFSTQKNDFYDKLDKGSSSLPFTKDNILQFFNNIFMKRQEYFKKGIQDLFEEITSRHQGNRYGEGWKTNRNWKINKKIIVEWGVVEFDTRYSPDGSAEFKVPYSCAEWVNDLDKIVRKIKPNGKYGFIKDVLKSQFQILGKIGKGDKFDNTAETPYFDLKFYKKGTLHIVFKDNGVLEELNKIGAKLRTDLGYEVFGKKEATT